MSTLNESQEDGVLIDPALLSSILSRLAELEKRLDETGGGVRAGPVVSSSASPVVYVGKFIVFLSTSLATDQWEYTLKKVTGGGTSHHGLLPIDSTTYKARNTTEELTKAGYVNSNVTGLQPIKNGKIVDVFLSTRDGKPQLLFTEDNEPICS